MTSFKSSVAFCALLAACGSAFAQDGTSDQDGELREDTIIVLGTKLEQDLQDFEVSAEIFDSERLAREQITELSELLLKVPNVTTVGGADSNFSIRGIGRAGVGGAGQGVTSSVYVDGSPITSLNFNRGPIGLWDTEQVEVLRGPQSSVQGRNALAGGIFIKTADPTFETEGKARVTLAEGNTYQYAGALGGPLIDGLLAGRIAVDFQGSDGFLTSRVLDGDDFNKTESLMLRGKLLLAPESVPQFSTKLTVDYGESEVFGEDALIVRTPDTLRSPNFFDFDPSDRETARNELVGNDNEGLRFVSETQYDFTDALTGRAIITYEDYSTLRTFGDGNDVQRFGGFTQNQFDEIIFSTEARVEFDFGTFRGLVGGYYLEEERKSDRDQRANLLDQGLILVQPLADAFGVPATNFISVTPPETLLLLRNGETFDTENYAIFGQFDWEFAPKWTFGLAARYDAEEFAESGRFFTSGVDEPTCMITAPGIILGIPGGTTTQPCGVAVERFFGPNNEPTTAADFEAFLPRASLTYDINDNSSVFVSLSRGYRAGGAFVAVRENENIVGNEQFVGQYDPEFLNTVEIGMRNELLDGRLIFNANVFYSEYEDQQVRVDGFNPARTDDDLLVNAGESKLYGLEMVADYDVTDNWGAFITLGLLETEFTDFPFAVDADGNPQNANDPQFANLAGNSFPSAPNLTFTIGTDWDGDNGLFANASLSYTGETESSSLNISNADLRQALSELGDPAISPDFAGDLESTGEERTDLTGRFGYRNDQLQVYVFGSNLLDSDNFTSRGFANVGAQSGQINLTTPTFTVQAPRVIGVGIDVNF
ncbi:MAG: TonB-dependent receptor [Pseudomonadota bacterium]